jgi:hypothetical protein
MGTAIFLLWCLIMIPYLAWHHFTKHSIPKWFYWTRFWATIIIIFTYPWVDYFTSK